MGPRRHEDDLSGRLPALRLARRRAVAGRRARSLAAESGLPGRDRHSRRLDHRTLRLTGPHVGARGRSPHSRTDRDPRARAPHGDDPGDCGRLDLGVSRGHDPDPPLRIPAGPDAAGSEQLPRLVTRGAGL